MSDSELATSKEITKIARRLHNLGGINREILARIEEREAIRQMVLSGGWAA